MEHSERSLRDWKKDWKNRKPVEESRPSRLPQCWSRPEYWEKYWRPEESCWNSDASERSSASAGMKNLQGRILLYEVHTISFQTFFVWAFKIVVDSWEFSILLLYILWDDWPIFIISGSNQQLQQQLEYTLLKPDCHSWWISKMQSDTLEERYAIKFCFKLGKNAKETYAILQTAFGQSCMNRASVFESYKKSKEGKESVRDDERCGRSKEVWTPELIGLRLRIRVTMLRF